MISSGSQRDLHSSLTNSRPWRVLPNSGHLHTLFKYTASSGRSFWSCSSQGWQLITSVNASGTFDSLLPSQEYSRLNQHHIFLGQPDEALQLPKDCVQQVKAHSLSGGFCCKEQEVVGKAHCVHMRTPTVYTRTPYTPSDASLLSCPNKPFAPSKYHTVYCAFWREILEALLLVEFHQIKGHMADQRLTQGHLLSVKRDTSPSRYHPAHFQATYNLAQSPSRRLLLQSSPKEMGGGCELQALLSQTPLPLGLPGNRWVVAQGLSLEYLTMINGSINIIWELVGLG